MTLIPVDIPDYQAHLKVYTDNHVYEVNCTEAKGSLNPIDRQAIIDKVKRVTSLDDDYINSFLHSDKELITNFMR